MTTQNQQFLTLLTEFAQYLGEQDKAILTTLEQKITQLKNDLLGGEVAEDLDTIRELAEELRKLKAKGNDTPEALVAKLTEFKTALDGVVEKLAALNNIDLKAAYLRGKNS